MSTLPEKATFFFQNTAQLQSFPVFITYLACILLIPLWKRILPQFELKSIMIMYNITAVGLSIASTGLLFYGAVVSGKIYDFVENRYIVNGLALYTIAKNFELLDTLFMILRKKWRQISFLHIFHHSTILILGNYAYIYSPFPPVAIVIGLNSLVHVFLYGYYAMTAVSSSQTQTWKKMLTQFQIAQFVFDLIFSTKGYLHHGFCIYSIIYASSMMILFSNFYYHAYVKKRKEKKEN